MDRIPSGRAIYEFGPFRFDPSRRELTRDGETIKLTPKVIDTLRVFVENPGKVLEKDFMYAEIWPDTIVEEANLAVNVSMLRKALGEDLDERKYIVTMPGRGYQFVEEVRKIVPSPVTTDDVDLIVQESSRITISERKEEAEEPEETTVAVPLPQGLLARLSLRTTVSKKGLVAIGILILLLPAGGYVGYRLMANRRPEFDWRTLKFTRLADLKSKKSGYLDRPRFSPNGTLICYSAPGEGAGDKMSVWVMQVDFKKPTQITWGPSDDTSPLWSPDSQQIAFVSNRGGVIGIWAAPYLQGDPVLLKELGAVGSFRNGPMLKQWGDSGKTIYYEVNRNFYALDIQSKQSSQITNFDPDTSVAGEFRVSPDGHWVVYKDRQNDQIDLWLMPREGGKPGKLTDDRAIDYIPIWCPDSREVIYSSMRDDLLQIFSIDIYHRTPRQVTRGEGHGYASDVSSDGTRILEYLGQIETDIFSLDLNTGQEQPVTADVGLEFWPAVSYDGSNVAYQRLGRDKETWGPESTALISRSINRQSKTGQLSLSGSFSAEWSPTSNTIAFLRHTNEYFSIWTTDSAGSDPKQLANGVFFSGFTTSPPLNRFQTVEFSWSPDGRTIAYSARREKISNIWAVAADGSGEVNWSNNQDGSSTLFSPIWSPDGKTIAYLSRPIRSQQKEMPAWQLWTTDGGQSRSVFKPASEIRVVGWSNDSDEVIAVVYEKRNDTYVRPTSLKILAISASRGLIRQIAELNDVYLTSFRMSPQGNSMAYVAVRDEKCNIYQLGLNGEINPLTNNNDQQIFYSGLAWSSNAKSLFYGKDTFSTWITMISDER